MISHIINLVHYSFPFKMLYRRIFSFQLLIFYLQTKKKNPTKKSRNAKNNLHIKLYSLENKKTQAN